MAHPAPATAPTHFAITCSIPGCRWRVLFPVTAHLDCVGRRLARLGWREDPDDVSGFICHTHGNPRKRADA